MARHAILAAVVAAIMCAACSTAPQQQERQVILQACGAETPARPIMPTESLSADAALDDFVKSAIAEIERREGYEQLLLHSLIFCKTGEVWK